MIAEEQNVFSLLVKPLQRAIEEKGFSFTTDPQREAIPIILEGKNVLLIAPTATGKTEAAMLPILNNFLLGERLPGIKILYITPLRALNRDLLERLEWWCKRLDVKIAVRHGDTDVAERSKQACSPPDMLITTPETLQAILPGRLMRRHLRQIRWVVIDEIHELACDKRGSQLALGLQRLKMDAAKPFQIVGLSATIGSPESVAQFLVGVGQRCEIVRIPLARDMNLDIIDAKKPTRLDYELAAKLYTHPEVATRLRIIKGLIQKHSSVLLFTNTRSIAEVLASRFKVWDVDFPVSIHHGSLAKPSRIVAERGLKDGKLKGLVCTSSLELGIDIGSVDLVIQYNSPRQVTRLVQRVGRSGHRIGKIPKGVIITLDSDDTLEALAIARRAKAEDLEPVAIPEKPLDALCHQTAGLLTQRGRWHFLEILELARGAFSYRNLTVEDVEGVVDYMHSRYPRFAWASLQDQIILRAQRLKSLYEYYFNNLSMIPDEKQYLVVDEKNDTPVGILDEAFVAEYGEPGVKFIVRGSPWKIRNVYHDKIYVRPVADPTGAIPSWTGEEIPVPFEVAMEVGSIRRFAEESLDTGKAPEETAAILAEKYPTSQEVLVDATHEAVEQLNRGLPIPTDKRITVEEWKDYVILQCCFGSLVNKTLARIIAHILAEETGEPVAVQDDPYRIVIQTLEAVDAHKVTNILYELAKHDIAQLAVEAMVKTGLFKRRMVHVGRKFGALAKWADFSNLSLKQLIESFKDTAIYDEAVKDALATDMDVENTCRALQLIRDGAVDVVILKKEKHPTPIARIGIERISRKTDIIPPEKLRAILIESTHARLLNEAAVFACTNCWQYVETQRMKDIPRKIRCPKCSSTMVGMLKESEELASKICEKKTKTFHGREEYAYGYLTSSAELISKFGSTAALALAGHNLRPEDVERILNGQEEPNEKFLEFIIEAEKEALKRRFE
ncbi:MAG: DEAD/DEAH box helicase [Candidatus Bathyarchaeia archaeon]